MAAKLCLFFLCLHDTRLQPDLGEFWWLYYLRGSNGGGSGLTEGTFPGERRREQVAWWSPNASPALRKGGLVLPRYRQQSCHHGRKILMP